MTNNNKKKKVKDLMVYEKYNLSFRSITPSSEKSKKNRDKGEKSRRHSITYKKGLTK